MKRFHLTATYCAVILLLSASTWAEMEMRGMEMGGQEKKGPSTMNMPKSGFVKEMVIEGMKTKFEITTMAEHEKMMNEMKMKMEMADKSATHHIAVTFYNERTGKEISEASVNMKVVSPSKKEQIKLLIPMPEMKHFGNDFNLSEKGKYEILILFKIGDKKREG
jgi:hypothetical protein